jgi:hypothetical protein
VTGRKKGTGNRSRNKEVLSETCCECSPSSIKCSLTCSEHQALGPLSSPITRTLRSCSSNLLHLLHELISTSSNSSFLSNTVETWPVFQKRAHSENNSDMRSENEFHKVILFLMVHIDQQIADKSTLIERPLSYKPVSQLNHATGKKETLSRANLNLASSI